MAVVEITIKIPGSCAECEFYHCDRTVNYNPEYDDEFDIWCGLDDDDGNISTDMECAYDAPPSICPFIVIAEAIGIEYPEAAPPPGYKEEDYEEVDSIIWSEDSKP